MNKLRKIITLLRLLQENNVVSIRKIVKHCEISERTVYRYIKNLSEAGVPVFYDYHRGGYRLANSDHVLCGILPAPPRQAEFERI